MNNVLQSERIVSASEAVGRSIETGQPVRMAWNPLVRIGLEALGGLELEPGVFLGVDHVDRRWIVVIK